MNTSFTACISLCSVLAISQFCLADAAKAPAPTAPARIEYLCPLKPDPPPVIDGDNREWELVPNTMPVQDKNVTWGRHNYKGEEDLSGSITLCCDQNYLYLLTEVVDDKLVVEDGKIFITDHIEFSFVPMFDATKKGLVDRKMSYILGFSPGNFENTGDPLLDIEASGTMVSPIGAPWDGLEVESSLTEEGYILEARIPWRIIGVKPSEVKRGATFAIDVHLSDSDNGPTQETLTSLNPVKWAGRRWENMLKLTLVGTDGKPLK